MIMALEQAGRAAAGGCGHAQRGIGQAERRRDPARLEIPPNVDSGARIGRSDLPV